ISLPRVTGRHVFRLAFHFGLFQFLMPVAGWLCGRAFAGLVGRFDHWIAFAVLTFVGGKMLWEARSHESKALGRDPTRGWTLVAFAVATSLDALAVGVIMALQGVSVWAPAVVIGAIAAAMSWLGVRFGSRLGKGAGRWGDAVGGLILIAIGARILIGHFSASN
ncbi:MAG: manganese efflux pump MntP family protein, partial [Planctomycetota bacterium]|nr:manganese efflux pump MntP family protein [Planctomycetota bacterium]